MIFYGNRLIWGVIKNTVKTLLRGIYAVINFLNLQLALIVALVGAVLYFTGLFENSRAALLIFYAALIFSIVLAIVLTIRKLLGLNKKVERKKEMQVVSAPAPDTEERAEDKSVEEDAAEKTDEPVYFAINGRPGYYMAEFCDRYEMYYVKDGKFIKIREDKKKVDYD